MKQIRELSQQLADLEVAAKVVVDMVEDEGAGEKSLMERLREAPQRFSSFFSDTSREYLAHALVLVKSFLPVAQQFSEYVTDMKTIADRVISRLEPAPEA